MNELLVWSLEKARQQTFNLVADLTEAQMCLQTVPGENHPAWTLGHLYMGDCMIFQLLQPPDGLRMPEGWMELYAPGRPPNSESARYHKKDDLIAMLKESERIRRQAIRELNAADLARPTPDERFAAVQPTVGHLLHYLLFHEGNHGGQLASWRKRQGLPSGSGAFGVI